MTRTIVESASKTAIIGFDQPFCVIGERINPTGRKKLAAELEAGDFSTVEKDALAQVAAGANILDINAGVVYNSNPNPNETEPPLMVKMIELVQGLTDCPICIDSSVPAALEAGLKAAKGRPLLNSVTGEEERLEFVLPLVKKYNVPVVAISNDDTGISEDPDVRFEVAKKIVQRAAQCAMGPIPPRQCDQPLGDIGAKALLDWFCRYARHHCVGRHIFGDNRHRGHHRPIANAHLGAYHRAMAHPCVMANMGHARCALFEKCGIRFGIVPVIGRAIQKMVQAGLRHGVIGGANAREGCDICEFANLGIGNIGIAVAIAVITKAAVLHAAALANFHKGTKFGIGDLAIGVDERLLAQTWHEDYSPLINLLRNQPDRLSMAMTIKITKVM